MKIIIIIRNSICKLLLLWTIVFHTTMGLNVLPSPSYNYPSGHIPTYFIPHDYLSQHPDSPPPFISYPQYDNNTSSTSNNSTSSSMDEFYQKKVVKLVKADPFDACSILRNAEEVRGNAVFVSSGKDSNYNYRNGQISYST